MRKKTIKYTIVDLGGTRYVVLRLADLDALITTHHSLSLELIPALSEVQWERHRQLLYITQHIHVERVSHCKVALLSKTDYDSLNLAISHLHTLLGNIRLASITVGPSEDESSAINQQQNGQRQAPAATPDPKGGHYVIHIEDIVRDNGRSGLAIYGEILQETDHETSASRVASLLKGVITSNPDIIGEVMIDTINRNREGKR